MKNPLYQPINSISTSKLMKRPRLRKFAAEAPGLKNWNRFGLAGKIALL
jgi:hypothetical protein